jgi:hypothetical protein
MRLRIVLAALASFNLLAQGPGRGIPDLTAEQKSALTRMTADLAPQMEALTNVRAEMIQSTYAEPFAAVNVAAAELALANARAAAFAAIQSSPAKLAPSQVASLIAAGGVYRGAPPAVPNYTSGGTIPGITRAQVDALTELSTASMPLAHDLSTARAALIAATFAEPADESAIRSKADAVQQAELNLAQARHSAFTRIQRSSNHLAPDQVAKFVALGGSFAGFAFTLPEPLNFPEHAGYVSLFDGKTLQGWDGNPKFWRVEDGAIVGESTAQNPSGNTYLVYRDMVTKDFTLKFEIKVEGSGGSGFQYRSKTGLPWLANIAPNVTANVGPVNLNWMMTGPQADFWPSSRDWSGQFYSENTPMRIQAWRGQVVEGSGLAKKQLMGNIGDRQTLGTLVKMDDWNEYTVIARGGTMIQILNGQLMAVMVDDDPNSSNNQPGLFGIEIEATTKVSVRNIWVKRFD